VRAREGSLTFDDLIVRVREVLRDNDGAREAFRERFAALLIDEFQDTDPLQMEIALAFARERDGAPLEAGRLFLVGDPKQSIYRFRRADMEMYSRTRDEIAEAGAQFPELALNRRSRTEILSWVNAVFAPLIGEGAQPGVQPPYREVHADRDVALRGPGVAWMGGETDLNARDVRDEEARAIAAQCRAAIAEKWQVQDRDRPPRDASYRDIAVLIPRRILLTALERALADASVPYRVEGGSLIYRTQEVRDIINCLTAIDDPADEVAVAGALRSPAFACSDVDLAAFATDNYGRFDYLRRDLEGRSGPVAEALLVLRGYHEHRHETSLAAFVEKLIWQQRVVEVGTIDQADRNAFRRARFLVEQARAFERVRPESLRAFVSWLEQQSARMVVDHEGAGIDDDEDAVRIMTIHAAKGLEFPVAILAGLSAAPNTADYPTYLADHAAGRAGVHAGYRGVNREFLLGDYADLRAAEIAHSEAEMDRLLYVAATRGRDHLIVSLYHTKRQKTSCARRLIANGAQEHAPELAVPPTVTAIGGSRLSGLTVELPDGLDRERLEAGRVALVDTATTRHYTSATAIKREADGRRVDEERERADASEPWSRGRGGTRLGRAVHAAIQSLPLDPDEATIEAFCRAQAVAEAIPHEEAVVRRLVSWVVRESDAWKRARAATRALREAPFVVTQDDAVLEGFVDLLIETADGIELIDWKTDHVPADAVEERLRQYELQAGLYVHGVQEATGRPVTRQRQSRGVAGRSGDTCGVGTGRAFGDAGALAESHSLRLSHEPPAGPEYVYGGRCSTLVAAMPRVKVATLNLFNRMSGWEQRQPLVIDQLIELLPDVIGFQEVDLMIDQGMAVSRAVNERLAEEPHYRIKHATTPGLMASIFGIGTLARIECLEHEVLDLMTFERIAQRMVYAVDGVRFALVNTHLHHPPEAADERAQQAEYILRWLDRHEALPTVVSGDFNSYEGEPVIGVMKSRFRSACETANVRGRARHRRHEEPLSLGLRDGERPRAGEDVADAGEHVR